MEIRIFRTYPAFSSNLLLYFYKTSLTYTVKLNSYESIATIHMNDYKYNRQKRDSITFLCDIFRISIKVLIFNLCALADASCSNEAVHLQQRLRSLSTELVTLRNSLNQGQGAAAAHGGQGCPQPAPIKQSSGSNFTGSNNNNSSNNNNNNNTILAAGKSAPSSPSKSTLPPPVLPRTSLPTLPVSGTIFNDKL